MAAKGITEIALPKFGCGIDGLNRDTAFRLIERSFANSNFNYHLRLMNKDRVAFLPTVNHRRNLQMKSIKPFILFDLNTVIIITNNDDFNVDDGSDCLKCV